MSRGLLWRHIDSVFIQATIECYSYAIGISMTRTFQKGVGQSVCLPVRPLVTLQNRPASLFNSRIIIRI